MSLVFSQKIVLDITISRVQNIYCSQDDDNSRNIIITLSDNGKPYVLPDSAVFLKISKPDNTFIYLTQDNKYLYINHDDEICVTLSDQATCVPGICEAELQIVTKDESVTTCKFNIIVRKSVVSDNEIESTIETNVIKKFISHILNFSNPHKVDKSQVGLGNVPNVETNDQTPTYEESDTLINITSGEKLSIAFGKISKAIGSLIDHIATKSTTEQEGHVSLTDSITSDSTTTAATPNSVKTVKDLLDSEISRAKSAESTLATNLSNEVTRAKSAENTNANAISTETTRATAKENEIVEDLSEEITRAKNEEALKAPLASPALTGTPTAPTASAGTNTTQIATTAFVQTDVSNHNTSTTSHSDIRDLITGLTTRLNTLVDSDDTTLDQLSEIVAYIKSNRTLIENITTNKVNVVDIVDNLTSTATNKPLSAKQGKVLNDLISSLTSVVNTKIDTINGDTYIDTSKSGTIRTITHKDVARTNTTSTASPSHGGTFTAVKTVTSDAKGHVIGVDTETVTLPTYTALKNPNAISVNGKTYDGSSAVNVGVIGAAYGGTGQTTLNDSANALINSLSTGDSTPSDTDYYVAQYASGGITTTTYHRRPMSALWNYIKSKLATVATSGSYNDLSNKPTIPTVGNGTVTIKQAGTSKGTFTMNQSGNTTIELTDNNTTYGVATQSANGLESAADKKKLDGIATGAEVNQNAFSNVVVGSTTISADSKTDSLTLVGSNVTITPDADNDKVTIGITKSNVTSALGYTPPTTNTTYSDMTGATTDANGTHGLVPAPTKGAANRYLRSDGAWSVPPDNNTVYTHPTTSGNKHIPSGGSSGQILRWSADGTAVWGADNNTTYSDMKGATSSAAGTHGLVPAPASGKQSSFLRGDGIWAVPTDTNTWRPLGTTADTACAGNDSRLSNARPASDVYSWAKASSKPSYSWSEITSKPSTFTPSSHTHSYLPLSGGDITGNVSLSKNDIFLKGITTSNSEVRLIGINNADNIHVGDSLNNSIPVFIDGKTYSYEFVANTTPSGFFRPVITDKCYLGGGSNRWLTVYAKNTTISTSDRNMKREINDIDEKYSKLFDAIKPKTFMFNDGDRVHIGAISQDIEDSMNEIGIKPEEFAGFCKDIVYEYDYDEDGMKIENSERVSLDENGNTKYIYSLRYAEFIMLAIDEIQKLKSRVAELENK